MGKFEEAVRGVIDGLDGDDDVVEAVRSNINFEEVVGDVLENDAKAKAAVRALVIKVIESLDPDENSDLSEAINEQFNIGSTTEQLLTPKKGEPDAELVAALNEKVRELVKTEIDGWDSDSETVMDPIRENINVSSEMVAAVLAEPEVQDALKKAVHDRTTTYVEEELDTDSIDESIRDYFNEDDNLSRAVTAALASPETQKAIQKRAQDLVDEWIENLTSDSDLISKALGENPALAQAVERELASALRSDRLDKLVARAIDKIVQGDASLQGTILGKVSDAIGARLAEGLLTSAFGRR